MNRNLIIGTTSIVIGVGCLIASVSAASNTSEQSRKTNNPCGTFGSGMQMGSGKIMMSRHNRTDGTLSGETLQEPPEGFGSGMTDRLEQGSGELMTPPEGSGSGSVREWRFMMNPCEQQDGSGTTVANQTKTTKIKTQTKISTKLQALREKFAQKRKAKAQNANTETTTTTETNN